jgi:hypothetical protein
VTRPRAARFATLPHAERVALRECILRGAAKNYAALDYAVAVFQRAAFEERPAAPRARATRKGGPPDSE